MSRRMDNTDDAPGPGHNALKPSERDEINQEAIEGFLALEKAREDFNKVQKRERERLNSVVKGELGYTLKVWKAQFLEPYKERENMEDQEPWKRRLEAQAEAARFFRLKFTKLKVGDQADFAFTEDPNVIADREARLAKAGEEKAGTGKKKSAGKKSAAKKVGENGAANANDDAGENGGENGDGFEDIADTVKVAGEKGFEAGIDGKNLDTNPYPSGSRQHQAFSSQWHAGQRKLAKGIKQTPKADTEANAVH